MITFDAFSKRFDRVAAVSDLTCTIGPGSIVAVLGPNGSGKTTSIKAAAGLIRPTSGRVRIGEPGRDASDPSARAVCAFLPQQVAFPPALTGREVMTFYGRLRGSPGTRTADALQLAGLNGASARAVGTYSGGMRQRLALAVALLPNAPVLLLDEPTAALDPDGLATFYRVVERRRTARQTLLFSSHQLGDLERLADRVIVLIGGRLAADFSAVDLGARLAERGTLTVQLSGASHAALHEALREIVPGASWTADGVVVRGGPATRAAAIEAIRSAGGVITGLTAEDGRLDAFYRELIGGLQ